MNMLELMRLAPVIPVIVIDDAKHAVPMAKALVEGGLRVLEVTLRTPAALPAVRAIATQVKDAIVGVGTITEFGHLDAAHEAGAKFAVSPGLTVEMARAARNYRIPLLPGTMTPTDVIGAMECGYQQMKFFPARQAGGVAMLQALHGPFAEITFCPTGGITAETALQYLELPNVACVGGSWVTPKGLLEAQDWEGIHKLAQEAAALRPAR
jgi:2-dehydro-3-deoxyphosphogluconate aldolase/(4S)-4-hydroxy-2-oxoglutarate aldolase